MKQVYLQKFGGEFFGDFVYAAYVGFLESGHYDAKREILFYNNIKEVPVDRDIMIVGCIEDTMYYFKQLGVKIPPAMNIPEPLKPVIKRKIWYTTKEEFLMNEVAPVFVKPVQLKACKAGLVQRDSSKSFLMSDAPDGCELLLSEPMEIINEYRAFINRHQLVGLRQYNVVQKHSDLLQFPDAEYVLDCVRRMNESLETPISYTMDFAVLEDGSTQVIECNDGWSVGSYGLDSDIYVKFLKDRWYELVNKPINLKLRLGNLIP